MKQWLVVFGPLILCLLVMAGLAFLAFHIGGSPFRGCP